MLKRDRNISLFKSNDVPVGHFTLIDTCTSHSQLLYRSVEFNDEGKNFNMDLLFVGVAFIIMPTSLMGLKRITQVSSSNSKELGVLIEPHIQDRKLVKLDYEKGSAYIVLEQILYYENELPPEDTSIPNKLEEPMTEEGILQMVQDIEKIGYTEYKKRFDDDCSYPINRHLEIIILVVKISKYDWENIIEFPEEKEKYSINKSISVEQFDKIIIGILPMNMEDKWFTYFENDALYLHRSWTGICIAKLFVVKKESGCFITEIHVNGDPKQFKSKGEESVKDILNDIDTLFS